MDNDDNIVQFFRNKDDARYSKIFTEFMAHIKEGEDLGEDFNETCRNYIAIGCLALREKIGYAELRKQLFGAIVLLDEHGEFD